LSAGYFADYSKDEEGKSREKGRSITKSPGLDIFINTFIK
jgi:hypothetical protein